MVKHDKVGEECLVVSKNPTRRSTRHRNRPVYFGETTKSPEKSPKDASSFVSPEAVKSFHGAKDFCHRQPDNRSSLPIPDNPVSSMPISPETIVSAAAAASVKEKIASSLVSEGKRKRSTLQHQQRPTLEECQFSVLELGKLHPEVIEKCREIRERTTVTTNVANDCAVGKDLSPVGEEKGSNLQASACGHHPSILDGVVSTMLSQNTTAANSTRAFAKLKKAVPDWNKVPEDYDKYQQDIETAIHCGGLAQKKAANIVDLCRTLQDEQGCVSLEYLREKSNEFIQSDLLRHKGLGPKTISCVLLFTLGRADFPVDTHVFRITKQHHWLPSSVGTRDQAYEYLNKIVPDSLKLELHCLLVQHGRECHRCAARGKPQFPPKDGSQLKCPLVHLDDVAAMVRGMETKKVKVKAEP